MDFSTDQLEGFYAPAQLHDHLRKLSALELLFVKEEGDLGYYNFTLQWDKDIDMCEINNGAGDTVYLFFTPKGAFIKGFDHESPISPHGLDEYGVWPGMYDGVPEDLMKILDDVSMEKDDVTFCIWNENDGKGWKKGKVKFENGEDDGSSFLLGTIYTTAEAYKDWADDYYEVEIPLEVLREFYSKNQLTDEMVLAINPDANLAFVRKQLVKIGY